MLTRQAAPPVSFAKNDDGPSVATESVERDLTVHGGVDLVAMRQDAMHRAQQPLRVATRQCGGLWIVVFERFVAGLGEVPECVVRMPGGAFAVRTGLGYRCVGPKSDRHVALPDRRGPTTRRLGAATPAEAAFYCGDPRGSRRVLCCPGGPRCRLEAGGPSRTCLHPGPNRAPCGPAGSGAGLKTGGPGRRATGSVRRWRFRGPGGPRCRPEAGAPSAEPGRLRSGGP